MITIHFVIDYKTIRFFFVFFWAWVHWWEIMILFVLFNWIIIADCKCLQLPLPLKKFCIFYHWQLSIFFNGIHCCPVFQCVTHVVSSFAIILERKKVIKIFLNIYIYTLQPKNNALARTRNPPREVKMSWFFYFLFFLRFTRNNIWNARSWKSNRKKPQEAARTNESYRKLQGGARSCCRSNCLFVYKCHVGGRNAQRLLAMLSIR